MVTMLLAAIFPSFITMEKAQAQIPGFVTDMLGDKTPKDNNYNNYENGYNPNEIDYTTTANSYDDESYNEQYNEPYYNEDSYSYDDNKYYDKYPTKDYDNDKKPIVIVKKMLFVCDEPMDDQSPPTREFFCKVSGFDLPFGPDSGEYIPCTADICPSIDESDFAVQIFKDVATVQESNTSRY